MLKSVDSLPNIDPQLATDLKKIGIKTADDLLHLGAVEVWQELVQAGLRNGLQSLLALEGAVEGVKWSMVPFERRQELALEAVSFSQGFCQSAGSFEFAFGAESGVKF